MLGRGPVFVFLPLPVSAVEADDTMFIRMPLHSWKTGKNQQAAKWTGNNIIIFNHLRTISQPSVAFMTYYNL